MPEGDALAEELARGQEQDRGERDEAGENQPGAREGRGSHFTARAGEYGPALLKPGGLSGHDVPFGVRVGNHCTGQAFYRYAPYSWGPIRPARRS
ncbi:hypothetical protein GCM10025866_18340 [Naasia aerilata]|uniref:Uncharacterized protein n=1 Tax=Naasia aerilata TaxID=1162966 RepID=A0ABM8GCF5_9MICO|nr:hypothetical protein GCM10025866_18340 [Naasia aerilata]